MLKTLKKFVKAILSVPQIRKVYEKTNLFVLNVFASNRLTATVYSILGFATFNREQFAVLRGRRDYYKTLYQPKYSSVGLRRNIHRLEKGMIMRPARPIFAVDYVLETIDLYEKSLDAYKLKKVDIGEIAWAHDVLSRYFTRVETGNSKVDSARTRFKKSLDIYNPKHSTEKAPYAKADAEVSDISYEQLLDLSKQRRSVRWFLKKKVPREKLEKALMVASQAPTACNRLPYKYNIFDDPVLVKKIAGIPFGAAGYSHQIPTVIVVTGDLSNYFSPRDRHTIYIDASLSAMSFLFALETLGLSSSVINWPDFEPLEIKMQKTLGLSARERVVMLIAVGYADPTGGIPFSQKKDLSSLRTYNELSHK